MRNILMISLIIFSFSVSAQKYAYVDTDYILNNIPEYKDAQRELDEIALEFQEEVEIKYAELDSLMRKFETESFLMPEEIREKKQDELNLKKQEVKDFQNEKFGPEGDLFNKREELIRPIQEKIYNAIEEIATEKNYAFVFDRSGSVSILYVQEKYDISDDILDKVGAVLGTVDKEDRVQKDKFGNYPSNNKDNSNTRNNNNRTIPALPGGNKPPRK